MQLSNEDNLRLNVLLAQSPQVIRINENRMEVQALTARGEAKVALNPTGHAERYLSAVRELLSIKATGSPSGYPVFMKRWTRTGYLTNNLEKMLLLGEPEAIVAVSHAPTITLPIAQWAWWANPSNEVAMGLLHHQVVVDSKLGLELAQQLIEFMPYEENSKTRVDMLRLCLQKDLLTAAQHKQLWQRTKRQNLYYVGFAFARGDIIPLDDPAHPAAIEIQSAFKRAEVVDNPWATMLCYLLSADGQRWLQVIYGGLQKPADPEVVAALFTALDQRFNVPKPRGGMREFSDIQQQVHQWLTAGSDDLALNTCMAAVPTDHLPLLKAMLVLSQLGENSLNPILGRSDAIGSVLRKHLKPLFGPVEKQVIALLA